MRWGDLAGAALKRVYSQTGEDGVLQALFASIGATDRYLVDLGAGDGTTLSNTRLLLEQGWRGARFDAARAGQADDVHQERVTAENVCGILDEHDVPRSFDLLSLDIDGNDFWVLRALLRGGYRPRVACVEINTNLPAEPPVTVAYDPGLAFRDTDYYGASLGAYRRLLGAHGYALVHVQADLNAFFCRADLVPADATLATTFVQQRVWPHDRTGRSWHLLTDADCDVA